MTVSEFLSAQIQDLISNFGGPTWPGGPIRGWSGADSTYVLVTLALTALCQLALVAWTHWQRRAAGGAARETRHQVWFALSRPLAALIWTYGVYLAATPLLDRLPRGSNVAMARNAMDLALDILAYAALGWLVFRATYAIEARVRHWAAHLARRDDDLLIALLGTGLRIVVVAVALIGGLALLPVPARAEGAVARLGSTVLILSIALLLSRTVHTLQLLAMARFDIGAADNLRARQLYTQLQMISRVIYVAIGGFALAAILMLFPGVRHVGTSLLASAGIAGVVVGFAAQKALGNLFAGLQLALTQTIRQDDVVVVEGEWGRVELITLTYVVVHVWDDRRLVLPLSYFIEKPFQNWTRSSSALIGSIFVWVDYRCDVEAARAALRAIIEGSALWDRRLWNLQVSELTEKSMQLRVLATASDSSRSWDLRCEIREKLIAYLQSCQPDCLPRSRNETVGEEPSGVRLKAQPADAQGP